MLRARIKNSIRSFPLKPIGGGFTGLLDEYGGAAAAYSVRRLSSTYTGALIEVRRTVSAVTVTADVAFDSNNELSLDSEITVTGGSSSATNLGEFVAAAGYSDPDSLGSGQNAFVRTWYDQSGNGEDAQQTTTSSQPQIANSGSLIVQGSLPAFYFDGSNDFFKVTTTSSSINSSYFLANLRMINDPVVGSSVFGSPSFDNKRYWLLSGAVNVRNGGTTSSGDILTNFSTRGIVSLVFDNSTTTTVYENGGSVKNRNVSGSSNTDTFVIGDWGDAPNSYRPMEMNLSEFILYQSDESANNTGIQSNQNTYFSIY